MCIFLHISSIKSGTEVVEDVSLRRIERIFRFCYHQRDIDTALVRQIALNMSGQNQYNLMISFSNHFHMYYFVHISCIKSGREVVEDLSLRRIQQIFRFCYHWRAINIATVRSIALKMSQQNHSHLTISFSKHYHMHYFVRSILSNQVQKW